MRQVFFLSAIALVLGLPLQLDAQQSAAGMDSYLEGLDNLEKGQYAAAADAFSRALEADEENINFYIARAVANALGEKIDKAEKDLNRAGKLDPANREVRLWLAAVYDMKGDFMKGSATASFAVRGDSLHNLIRTVANQYGRLSFRKTQNGGRIQEGEDPEYLTQIQRDREKAKAQFPEIAQGFAQRHKGNTGDIAPLLVARAQKAMAQQQWAAALADLQKAAQSRPQDLGIVQARAFCNVHLGAAAAAREQFTRVLTAQPQNVDAYLGRALAATALGDCRRAQHDLRLAIELVPARGPEFSNLVEQAALATPAPQGTQQTVAGMLEQLRRQGAAGASKDDMFKGAIEIVRTVNNYRLRADETYLDRRVALTTAVQKNNNSPDVLADLGEFLYREAVSIRGEAVEPRAPTITYRPQTEQSQRTEMNQAHAALDKALSANPRHVKALTFKAACLMFEGNWSDAETLLRKALDIDPTYGPLLETFAEVLNHAAAVKSAAAADLRSTKSWEDTFYRYWRTPSAAELAMADKYAEQAQRLWALAEKHLQQAARLHAGKDDGFYYEGILAKQHGDSAAAVAAFEQCVKANPRYVQAWDQLAAYYWAQGKQREAAYAKSAAANLSHTTAGPLLRYVWSQIPRTAYRSAREALVAAMSLDPADPRVSACLAVIAAANDDESGAAGWFRAASALEEARLTLAGVSPRSKSTETVTAGAAGLAMAINVRLGRLEMARNNPSIALAVYQDNIALFPRIPKDDRYIRLPASMLPDMQTDPMTIPEADIALSLAAWSYAGAGQALLAMKNPAEAVKYLDVALRMPEEIPPTVDARFAIADAYLTAKIAGVQLLLDQNQIEAAWQLARKESHAAGGSRELNEQFGKLYAKLQDLQLKKQNEQNERDQAAMRRYYEEQIRKAQQQQRDRQAAYEKAAREQQQRRSGRNRDPRLQPPEDPDQR